MLTVNNMHNMAKTQNKLSLQLVNSADKHAVQWLEYIGL